MSVNPAVQTLFSGLVLENFNKAHVWEEGTNNDYEGEIKGKGDVLRIFQVGRPTVNAYTGSNLTYDRLRPTAQTLVIDQDNTWSVKEDHLEAMLEKVDTMTRLARNGAYALADKRDQYIAFLMCAQAAQSLNAMQIGNGAGDDKAYDAIAYLVEALRNKDVPSVDADSGKQDTTGLHVFVPHWFMTRLRLDTRMTGFGTDQSRKTARGEYIGELEGAMIHETSNSPDSAGTAIGTAGVNTVVACWDGATTYGAHIPDEGLVQFFDSSGNINNFDKLMRARHVFGAAVTHPEAIVKVVCTRGS